MPSTEVGDEVLRNRVRAIIDRFAGDGNPFARRDRSRLADDGHEITMPARLGSEHAEPVLLVVEGDPLNQAGQDFLRRSQRIGIHLQAIYGASAFLRNGRGRSERIVCRALQALAAVHGHKIMEEIVTHRAASGAAGARALCCPA